MKQYAWVIKRDDGLYFRERVLFVKSLFLAEPFVNKKIAMNRIKNHECPHIMKNCKPVKVSAEEVENDTATRKT